MTDSAQVIFDAVVTAHRDRASRRCVHCRRTGIFGGDYPQPIDARGDTFAHWGCHADEIHEQERWEEDRLRDLEDQEW